MKNKKLIDRIFQTYLDKHDDYYEAKSDFIKDLNNFFSKEKKDNNLVIQTDEVGEAVRHLCDVLRENGVLE